MSLSNSTPTWLIILTFLVIFARPTHAFGAGNIASSSSRDGYNWRHGDIEDVLLSLPVSFITAYKFSDLEVSRVYFGNWLRDYSQFLDVGSLTKAPEPLLRAVVSVLGFLQFGYATREFDVTASRLGVYRPEEHIDNPKGYDENARKVHQGLRGPVHPKELQVDEATGMKNYIANESLGIDTSTAYIRRKLKQSVVRGRAGRNDDDAKAEALASLGAALHCLEDFAAHSNYIELVLRLIGKQDPSSGLDKVFVYVGDAATTPTRLGPAPPIVTGTFGPLDLYQSILGEVDDKAAAQNLNDLEQRLSVDTSIIDEASRILKLVLSPLSLFDVLPKGTIAAIDSISSGAKRQEQSPATWDGLLNNSSLLWDSIEPVFRLRDDIAKALKKTSSIPFAQAGTSEISQSLDKFVFAVLSVAMKPILEELRSVIQEEKDALAQKDTIEKAGKDGPSIFDGGSANTDPTHSQLSKDHFDVVLNTPAGLVATVVANLTTQAIVNCWDNDSVDENRIIDTILKAIHHPYNAEASSPMQSEMFAAVLNWWTQKSTDQKARIAHLLKKETVQKQENHDNMEPSQGGNRKGAAEFKGSAPATREREADKSLQVKLLDNITKGISDPVNTIATKVGTTVNDVIKVLETAPTPDLPNPVDMALTLVNGKATDLFKDISINNIKAGEGMGNIMKETVAGELKKAERTVDEFRQTVDSGFTGAARAVDSFFSRWR